MEFRAILHEKAECGEKFKFEEVVLHTTFDVIGKATFGHSLNAKKEGSAALEHWEAMTQAFASTRESHNFIKNFLAKKKSQAERKKLDAILADLVKKRFDVVVREKTDLSNRKGLSILDLVLRDYVAELRQSNKKGLDTSFLETAIIQIKALLIGGSGTTSDVICFTMML